MVLFWTVASVLGVIALWLFARYQPVDPTQRAWLAFCRKLGPRQGIAPHVDAWMPGEADWRRFQVPLVSDPRIIMRWPDDGVELYLEPGWLYEVRFDRMHEVVNGADIERIHLQIDQVNATI